MRKGGKCHPVWPALGLPGPRDGKRGAGAGPSPGAVSAGGPGEIVVDFPGGSWYNSRRIQHHGVIEFGI